MAFRRGPLVDAFLVVLFIQRSLAVVIWGVIMVGNVRGPLVQLLALVQVSAVVERGV
jgi:hypothetical protein